MTPHQATAPLSTRQVGLFTIIGVILALVFAVIIRFLGDAVFEPGSLNYAVAFVLAFAVGWAFAAGAKRFSGLSGQHLVSAVAATSAGAIIFDGTAISWFPGLYGVSGESLASVGAWLLFGVGVIISYTFLSTSPQLL